MEKIYDKNSEQGLTLIEVIASIVLIFIILLSFMSIFLQSNKTTVTSSDIVDATYLAQKEMENIYTYRKESTPEAVVNKLNEQSRSTSSPEYVGSLNTWEKQEGNIRIELTMELDMDYPELQLTTIIIKVYEQDVLKSLVENRYKIGA